MDRFSGCAFFIREEASEIGSLYRLRSGRRLGCADQISGDPADAWDRWLCVAVRAVLIPEQKVRGRVAGPVRPVCPLAGVEPAGVGWGVLFGPDRGSWPDVSLAVGPGPVCGRGGDGPVFYPEAGAGRDAGVQETAGDERQGEIMLPRPLAGIPVSGYRHRVLRLFNGCDRQKPQSVQHPGHKLGPGTVLWRKCFILFPETHRILPGLRYGLWRVLCPPTEESGFDVAEDHLRGAPGFLCPLWELSIPLHPCGHALFDRAGDTGVVFLLSCPRRKGPALAAPGPTGLVIPGRSYPLEDALDQYRSELWQ